MRQSTLRWAIVAVCLALASVTALAQNQNQNPEQSRPVMVGNLEGFTLPSKDLKISFTVPAEVVKVNVEPGQLVEAGATLMELDDREGESLMKIAELRSASDVEIRAAEAEYEQAQVELKGIKQMREGNAASLLELARAEVNVLISKLKIEKASQDREEMGHQLEHLKAKHEKYVQTAPAAGLIERVLLREGEIAEPQKPVLQMVVIDPLWVEAQAPLDQTMKLKVGDPAWIRYRLVGLDKSVQGKIIHLAAVADPRTWMRMVRIEVPNPELLPAGAPVYVSFTPPDGMAAAAGKGE